MEKWIPISDDEGAEAFLQRTRGLHDGLLREAVTRSRGFVARDRRMYGDTFPMDALLRFETQQPDTSVVELFVEDVQELHLVDFWLDPVLRFAKSDVILEFNRPAFASPCLIRGRRMSYRVLEAVALEGLGPLPELHGGREWVTNSSDDDLRPT